MFVIIISNYPVSHLSPTPLAAHQHLHATERVWSVGNDSHTHVDGVHHAEGIWVSFIAKVLKHEQQTYSSGLTSVTKKLRNKFMQELLPVN